MEQPDLFTSPESNEPESQPQRVDAKLTEQEIEHVKEVARQSDEGAHTLPSSQHKCRERMELERVADQRDFDMAEKAPHRRPDRLLAEYVDQRARSIMCGWWRYENAGDEENPCVGREPYDGLNVYFQRRADNFRDDEGFLYGGRLDAMETVHVLLAKAIARTWDYPSSARAAVTVLRYLDALQEQIEDALTLLRPLTDMPEFNKCRAMWDTLDMKHARFRKKLAEQMKNQDASPSTAVGSDSQQLEIP